MRFKVWTKSSFFNEDDFSTLCEFIPSVKDMKIQMNKDYKRNNFTFALSHPIHDVISKYKDTFNELLGIPVSYQKMVDCRLYKPGEFMEWHRDYDFCSTTPDINPIFEVVVTLVNTSDSLTEYQDENTREIVSLATKPNDCMILCRQGANHRVTPVTQGERWILKFQLWHKGNI